jgi:1-aminocyclopropane-1-carboxylate synthase
VSKFLTIQDYGAGGLRLGCVVSRNHDFTTAIRGGVCRFSSPSSMSMDIAVQMLQDRDFIRSYLSTSAALLAKQRLLAESLLDQAGIKYYASGYEVRAPHQSLANTRKETLAFSCGST